MFYFRSLALAAGLGFAVLPQNLQAGEPAELWSSYVETLKADSVRWNAHKDKKLKDGDKTMRFSQIVKGEKPADGYPLYIALHGGGTAPTSLNDSQWEGMKTYYLGGVKSGIMVATRGVTDTWNLHFVKESYRLYDQLIENMIAYEGVDPNRVYILGFSAGGDGVYQVTPRMADRFAAANMSAGHHNWIKFDNLFQTPFLIQMGQNDSAYKRNTVAVENYIELNRLQELRGGYVHDVFMHYRGSHNSWTDHENNGKEQKILKKPIEWLNNKNEETTSKNTNAVHWLDQHKRNPYPQKLVWDPRTSATRLNNKDKLFYWLDISQAQALPESIVLEAAFDEDDNTVALKNLGTLDAIRVLLHPSMLQLDEEIEVLIDGSSIGKIKVEEDDAIQERTLQERGDQSFMFSAQIDLKQVDGKWTIEAAP